MSRRKNNEVEFIYSKRTRSTRVKVNGVEIGTVYGFSTQAETAIVPPSWYDADPKVKRAIVARSVTVEFGNAKITYRTTR